MGKKADIGLTDGRSNSEYIPLQHGRDCKKEEHLGEGYLHLPSDDSPYNVDGLTYCGKCHQWIGHVR